MLFVGEGVGSSTTYWWSYY